MASSDYGVSYFGNRYPDHARADVAEMAAVGVTYVVHVMTEDDLRWGVGTVRDLVSATHDAGMDAWLDSGGVAGVFGGEAASYAVMEAPRSHQWTSQGVRKPALCPRTTAYRGVMGRWLDAAAATGARVVLWDEPHLFILRHQRMAEKWTCRCAT